MFKNTEKVSLGPFVITVLALVIIIISVIFAAVSQTNGNVQKNTEEHAVSDMVEDSAFFEKSIRFAYQNGITDFGKILGSETYRGKIVFVTDFDGNMVAKTELAGECIEETNIFAHFLDCEYLDDSSENIIRKRLRNGESGSFCVQAKQKEYLVFRSMGTYGFCCFYMLHDSDVQRLYSESEQYLKTLRLLSIAYATATFGLVVLMGSYIFSVVKSSELKLKLSSMNVKEAKEQVRTYSDITRVLTQTYEKIYYIDLSNGRYKLFTFSLPGDKDPMLCEGEDFWGLISEEVVGRTIPEDRERVQVFFDRQLLPEIVRSEGSKRIRFRLDQDGAEVYYYVKACPSGADENYLIVGLKNVDYIVMNDMKRLAEKDAALRRVDIYRSALLDNMVAYLELDVTDGRIVDGPIIADETNGGTQPLKNEYALPDHIDELAAIWGEYLYEPGRKRQEYIKSNTSAELLRKYESGSSIVEIKFDAKWNDGTVRGIRQNYYMSKRQADGHVMALCVLYDMTEQNAREREISDLTEELAQSRIKISTGQMQPHFLYNVLGSIREIILEDPQYASDLICDFTTHLRACIKSLSNDDLVPFSKEIENIKAYVNIERMRFGDRLQVEFDIRSDDFDVVPLSIQPLVENAIRHGIFQKKEGVGKVKVSAFRQNGFIVVVVKDNGVGFDYEKVSEEIREHKRDSTGLLNLTLRLEKILGAKTYFDSEIGVGTTVTILIPEKKEGASE